MSFPGDIYAPPGPYTRTNFESPVQPALTGLRFPVFIGTGSESLTQNDLELIRGSSSDVDQRVVNEDMDGRSVASISDTGIVTLGDFDGILDSIQVRNYPIVDGNGTGTTATNSSAVSVTINGNPIVVLRITGATGVLKLSTPPEAGDEVRVTYFFNRTDTQTTDDVSGQITVGSAVLRGAVGESYEITTGENDTLILTVDDENAVTVTLTDSGTSSWTASQIASFINSAATGTTLVASTYETNEGETAVLLTADRNIQVGAGTANSTLGLTNGDDTARNRTFYTFEGPIVDGTNGGVATTDPSDVVVKVGTTQVIPTSVNGATRAVVLPFAPEDGAVVTIQHWFNAWQDTFDYLAHTGVTEVTRCGSTPDRSDFTSGADFILKSDRILWGTAVTIESGTHTSGTEFFDDTQITATLVDVQQYTAECEPVTNTSVSPPVTSTTEFTLPLVPTTGNGRNSPLGSSDFQSVANDRIDLPTDRPDLVTAYWGYGLQDALDRGEISVTKVDSATRVITLSEDVPVGANVFATFYYNTLTDQEYTLTVEVPGAAGVGTYSVTDEDGDSLMTPAFGSKSSGLTGTTIQFPSGSERTPDVRFESPFTTTAFGGAVEEDVTVTFAVTDSTPAKYTVPGSDPYYTINAASDNFDVEVDGGAVTGGFVDLSNVNGISGLGFTASLLGGEVSYEADTGDTTFEIDSTNDELNLTVDGILIESEATEGTTQTLANYVTALNLAAMGETGTAAAGASTTITLAAGAHETDDYYVGWTVLLTNNVPVGVIGLEGTVTAYDGTTKVATVDVTWGTTPSAATTYYIYNADACPQYAGATKFTSTVAIAASDYDALVMHYTGDISGLTGNLTATIAPGTYTSASSLATAVRSAITTALASEDFDVLVEANSQGQLVFSLVKDSTDTSGYLEFIDGASSPVDFAVLAGIDTSSTTALGQTKLVNGPIAQRYTLVGDNTSALLWDRLILRNRLVPGSGSMAPYHSVDQALLTIEGSSGATLAGLTVNESAAGGYRAAVLPATLLGVVGFADGQASGYADDRDGLPVVTFYADGGTTAQNNVFKFTMDGVPVTVEFTDDSGVAIADGASEDVPLGPAGTSDTVINQIATAMATAGLGATAAAVIAAGLIYQEGAGIRLVSALTSDSSAIVIGTSNAVTRLGFVGGGSAVRIPVEADVMAAALMAHSAVAIADVLNSWDSPTSGYFAGDALAGVVRDDSNAEFLYLQSQANSGAGTSSSIAIDEAASDSVTLPGTGLGLSDGDGNTGEIGISGFYVTSSDTVDGSGTINTSLFNSGTGQDGVVGQTYRDLVTGLTFSVLEREGGSNYPDGETFTFTVRAVATTDSNIPTKVLPGVELLVTNTNGIGEDDTALVETYERGGNEPTIGDVYYATYQYTKQDFTARLFTKFSTIEAEYGTNSPDNPVTLASFMAILNGAVLVGIKQVEKDTDEDNDGINDSASMTSFIAAVDDLEGPMPGNTLLDIMVPLDVPSNDAAALVAFYEYLARHCDIQSTIRYRAERTAIVGLPAGTLPRTAGDVAESVGRDRFRLVYPDIATLVLTDATGRDEEFLVDGSYLASALSGVIVSPSVDVATPWTGRKIFGFTQLARTLDAVEQNQVAVRGVTLLEDRNTFIRVRQGFTTDMTNVLTKTPTVRQISDEVQQQSRATLENFIGIKFLPGVLSQIEGRLSTTLKLLVDAEILTAYTGVKANVAADDPTVAEVEAFYQPVFPLLYIVVTFNLRATL